MSQLPPLIHYGKLHFGFPILDANFWQKLGHDELARAINTERIDGVAKNVVFFVGDGLGVSTHTMARIYKGQKKGFPGEEESLVWETFPWTGISKVSFKHTHGWGGPIK